MFNAQKLGEAVLELSTDDSKLDRGLAEGERKTGKYFNAVKSIGLAAAAAIGAAMVAGAKMSLEYEDTLAKIVGLVGVNRDQVAQWRDELLELAPAVGKGPQELAEALFFITSAGLRGADAMDALTYAAKASSAGLGETSVVADALTSAMNAYASTGLTAAEATDVLVATVREGKAEADAIAGSIGNVVPLAAQMGVEFSEVGAVFAALTRIGSGVEEAATSLTALFAGLLKPTTDAEDALAEFGLSSEQLRRTLKDQGVLATLYMLEEAFGDNETAMARVFPNIRALRGVLGLVGQDSETVTAIFESLAESTGATDTAFQVAADTAGFRLRQSLSDLKGALIELGHALEPVVDLLSGLIGILADVIRFFIRVGEVIVKAARALDDYAASMRDVPAGATPALEGFEGQTPTYGATEGYGQGPLQRAMPAPPAGGGASGGLTINVNMSDSVITDQGSAERLLIPVIETAVARGRTQLKELLESA